MYKNLNNKNVNGQPFGGGLNPRATSLGCSLAPNKWNQLDN